MPADLAEALNKKGGLTLTQLANYDDILTDSLVDRVYFWANIRKVRPNARATRGIREEEVCDILQKSVIVNKDPTTAAKAMLRQTGFQNYMRSLKTEDEREHFQRHLRKYINIYLPDCPFEVCTTHRYTITTAEACVVARKPIKAGEAIRYLSGIQVEMTEEEEAGLSSRTDFSIVLSSRRKRPSLFLGPARFANHDCDSNARLTTTGPHGITIVACKNIAVGDEITVRYGEDYFGERNCECLCGTCERLVRNGWDPRGPILRDDTSDDESEAEEEERPVKRQRTTGVFESSSTVQEKTVQTSAPLKRKHETAFVKQESETAINAPRKRGRPRKYPISVDKVDDQYSAYGRDFLTQWIKARARQQDSTAAIDVMQVRRAAKRFGSERYADKDIPKDKKYLAKFHSVLEALQEHGQRELEKWQADLAALKLKNADLLHLGLEEAEKFYAPPGHADHVPLPMPQRGRVMVPQKSAKSTPLTPTLPRLGAKNPSDRQAKTAVSKARLAAMMRQHTGSPLRNVTTAREDTYVSDSSEHEQDSRKATKAKRASGAEARRTSTTDESPRSSVFSNEASAESPPSSHGDIGAFSAGNICQNIVEMYTSSMPGEDTDLQDAVQEQLHAESRAAAARNKCQRQSRRGPGSSEPRDSIEERSKGYESSDEDEDEDEEDERRGEPRTPGDYHLTPTLLIDINDRWIECRNCDEHFVQHDAYQTRIACPRCERHSKLYGYHWPKTDKAGKDDKEERILDHRLIHRFIEPDEERHERKGRRTLAEVLKERELSASQEAENGSRSSTCENSRRRSRRLA